MISFYNVTKNYFPEIVALDSVSLEIEEKEFVSIVGKSGAGKTTLLKLLLAEEKPSSGSVFFEGEDVSRMSSGELPRIRRKIGSVFQDYKLFSSKTAQENVAYVMEVIGKGQEEILSTVPRVLELVGLADRAHNFPEQLSGGEKQRVAIARALVHRPKVILADEPTGNLDPYNTQDIIRLLLKINELGTTVILATHNKEVINSLGSRIVTLDEGKVVRDEERGKFVL